mmetsp:Transcript_64248/g.139612  ORF Transcript_64248/g.139612 Transcript_64248/m.139612 type:complete len:298 (+) Transcript_64248:444-1337(+)
MHPGPWNASHVRCGGRRGIAVAPSQHVRACRLSHQKAAPGNQRAEAARHAGYGCRARLRTLRGVGRDEPLMPSTPVGVPPRIRPKSSRHSEHAPLWKHHELVDLSCMCPSALTTRKSAYQRSRQPSARGRKVARTTSSNFVRTPPCRKPAGLPSLPTTSLQTANAPFAACAAPSSRKYVDRSRLCDFDETLSEPPARASAFSKFLRRLLPTPPNGRVDLYACHACQPNQSLHPKVAAALYHVCPSQRLPTDSSGLRCWHGDGSSCRACPRTRRSAAPRKRRAVAAASALKRAQPGPL